MDFGRMVWMDDDILIRHRRVVRRGSALRQEEKRKIHADAPSPRTSASAVAGVAGAAEMPADFGGGEVAAVVRAKAAAVRIGDSECLPRSFWGSTIPYLEPSCHRHALYACPPHRHVCTAVRRVPHTYHVRTVALTFVLELVCPYSPCAGVAFVCVSFRTCTLP